MNTSRRKEIPMLSPSVNSASLAGPANGVGRGLTLPAQPQAVEISAVDSDGQPALDRPASAGGRGKRTLGSKVEAVLILGNPPVADADGS